jgi:hypothetical protein
MTVFPFPEHRTGHGGDVPALDGADTVELSFSARPERLVLARLVVAAVASTAGFDVAELDDLRLAVDELCLTVGDEAAGGTLHLRICTTEDEVVVECRHDRDQHGDSGAPSLGSLGEAGPDAMTAELSERILDALVDAHGRTHGRHAVAWFRKHRLGRGP